ncbi:MAG: radical SAM protein [bacterium]|nr:radical SAM protein [bacterium]
MLNTIFKAKRAATFLINPNLCRPKSARLVVTANCNFRCQMCTFWGKQHEDPSLEVVKYWIKEMADFGIKEIEIGGGEVTLRKDLPDMVSAIKAAGMKCGITTNGWLIGGGQVPFPEVDLMEVSIDGARPETHDKIRGVKGAFERAVKTVEMAKERGVFNHLNFTLQTDNYLELPEYCDFAKKLGVKVGIIPLSLKLAAQPYISDNLSRYNIPILKGHLKKAFASGVILNNQAFFSDIFFRKMEKGPYPTKCLAPYRCILIFINGDVYPCGNLDLIAGNLQPGKKLKDIWRDYSPLRKEIASGKRDFCNRCDYTDIATRRTIVSSALPYLKRTFFS